MRIIDYGMVSEAPAGVTVPAASVLSELIMVRTWPGEWRVRRLGSGCNLRTSRCRMFGLSAAQTAMAMLVSPLLASNHQQASVRSSCNASEPIVRLGQAAPPALAAHPRSICHQGSGSRVWGLVRYGHRLTERTESSSGQAEFCSLPHRRTRL